MKISLYFYSSVLSSIFLREKLNLLGKLGCALCVIGSTVMVLNSPQEQEVASMDALKEKIQEPGIICIIIVKNSLIWTSSHLEFKEMKTVDILTDFNSVVMENFNFIL